MQGRGSEENEGVFGDVSVLLILYYNVLQNRFYNK